MAEEHGTFVGVARLGGSTPPQRAWNLVILSEGFTTGELDRFRSAAGDVAGQMLSQIPPFSLLNAAMNIFRVDIASMESSAVSPTPGCGGPTPLTPFEARYCNLGQDRRIGVDDGLAWRIARQRVPEVHMVLVLVNNAAWGGKGWPGAAVASIGPQPPPNARFARMAVHEVIHTFGVADEYPDGGLPDFWLRVPTITPWDFLFPNITRSTDVDHLVREKWGRIATRRPWPTLSNDDCSQPNRAPNPLPDTTVGLYEGAFFHHCRIFRPKFRCFMKDSDNDPICPVCQDAVMRAMRPFVPPITGRPVALSVRSSGKVADVARYGRANGDPIIQWDWLRGPNQQWMIDDAGGGFVRIRSVHSGRVLDVEGMSQANGARIIQWESWNGPNQQWRLLDGPNGYRRIMSRHSGKVIDVAHISQDNGAQLIQWDDVGNWNQHWAIT